MAATKKSTKVPLPMVTYETASVTIGSAFEMPTAAALALAPMEEVAIDFQAKQDAISETRRSPGKKLAPKLKTTRAKPSPAREALLKF